MSKPPPPPSALRPDVPRGLDRVILRCLENDRARRYGSAEELHAALTPYAAPDAVQPLAAWLSASEARPVAPSGTPGAAHFPPAPAGTMSGTTSRVAGPWMTPARSIAIGAGVVAAVGLGAIAIAWSYGSGGERPAAASAAPTITAPAEPRGAPPAPALASTPPVVGPAPSGAPVAGNAKDSPSAASPAATKSTRAPAPVAATKATAAPKPAAKPQKAGPSDTHSMD
jgi:serine/threonine-protein kinase